MELPCQYCGVFVERKLIDRKPTCAECEKKRARRKAAEWYQANKERANNTRKEYYWTNPEKFREYAKRYRKEHLEEKRMIDKAYKNKIRHGGIKAKLIATYGPICSKCGLEVNDPFSLIAHHLQYDVHEFQVLLCRSCHMIIHKDQNGRVSSLRAEASEQSTSSING